MVYARINSLKEMREANLADEELGKFEQIPNIDALLEAYRTKKLQWIPGLVTHWSKGKQLSQPRRFDWDEFEALNDANEGDKGFWVEGVRSKR